MWLYYLQTHQTVYCIICNLICNMRNNYVISSAICTIVTESRSNCDTDHAVKFFHQYVLRWRKPVDEENNQSLWKFRSNFQKQSKLIAAVARSHPLSFPAAYGDHRFERVRSATFQAIFHTVGIASWLLTFWSKTRLNRALFANGLARSNITGNAPKIMDQMKTAKH